MSRTDSRILIALLGSALFVAGAVRVWAATPNGSATARPHHIQTVFIILMENHNWTGDGTLDIKGNPQAPYINNTLLPIASHAESYYNPPNLHPSLPNYLWLEAGTNFGILNDGLPSQNSQNTTQHLVTFLKNAGFSWKAYEENINGTDCPLVNEGPVDPNGSQLYAPKHDPFVYFDDVTSNQNPNSAYCIAQVRPYTELAADLQNNTVARYNFITLICAMTCTIAVLAGISRMEILGFRRTYRRFSIRLHIRRAERCSSPGTKRMRVMVPLA